VPLYEYQCRECESRFEQLVLSRETQVACRSCGSSSVSQLLSTFAVGAAPGASPRRAAEPGPCGACGAPERGSCMN
jgi:putative FmdB family regulatory protein